MTKPLVNRVAQSKLFTINLEEMYPSRELVDIDLKDFLFQGLILREKEFRSALKEISYSGYDDKIVLIYCSTDAIIPVWAYMLVAQYLEGHAFKTYVGTKEDFIRDYYYEVIANYDVKQYEDERVVIKGCSNRPVPPSAYAFLTERLKPFAQSIMYGEPCSTVPIFKRPRKL